MPVHDWTRVDACLFHHFHQDWTVELCRSLNAGRLPSGYVALIDQQRRPPAGLFVFSFGGWAAMVRPACERLAKVVMASFGLPVRGKGRTVP